MASATGAKRFGAGRFYGITANTATPTPTNFLLPQDQSLTLKRSNKTLHGENQLPAAVGAGEMTVTGKVAFGTTNARVIADLFFGVTPTTGQYIEVNNEAGTIGAGTPTYTVTNSATFVEDLGVLYVPTNARMTRVASGSETAGKSYSMAAGVYTFATGDESKNVKISYLYSETTSGEQLSITNPLQGPTGSFSAVHVFPWGTIEEDVITLNACLANQTEFGMKSGDFMKPTFDFDAFTDDNGILGTFCFAQAA